MFSPFKTIVPMIACATLAAPSAFSATYAFDTNLVQHHTFDTDVSDAFGRSSTAIGGATISGTGAAVGSGSLALDGTGAVDLGAKAFDVLNAFTVSSWVQLNSFDEVNRDFAAVYASDGWGGGHLHINYSDAFGGGIKMSAASPQITPSAGLIQTTAVEVPTDWVHVAVVVDGTSAALYINGNLEQSGTVSAAGAIDLGLAAQIGAYADDPNRTLTGNIDDFRIYDIALTESQVGQLVPEPTSLALLGLGGLMIARRRR